MDNFVEIIRKVEGNKEMFKTVTGYIERSSWGVQGDPSTIDTLHSRNGWHSSIEEALDYVPLDVWMKCHEIDCSPGIEKAVRQKIREEIEDLEHWWSSAIDPHDDGFGSPLNRTKHLSKRNDHKSS